MYEAFGAFDSLLALVLPIAWGLAAYAVGRLAPRRTRRGLRTMAWLSLVAVMLAEVLVAGRVATIGGIGLVAGWRFAVERVLLTLPLLVVPALAALVLAVPRLWRFGRGVGADPRSPEAASSAAPALVVPVRAAAVGAAIGTYLTLVPPAAPFLDDALICGALLAGAAATLWAWQARDHLIRQGRARIALRPWVRFARAVALLLTLAVGLGSWFTTTAAASRLPDRISMIGEAADYGGGTAGIHHHGSGATSVAALTGPGAGEPDRRFTLTARMARVQLTSGATVDAWTFDGQVPGPELRARQGELIEVTLVNQDIAAGVTIHWHGLDVPNAEDGVAGVTQDAVRPGQRHTYRFRAEQAGTFWYHSHQQSAEEVRRGLFGALIVEPATPQPAGVRDIAVVAHDWATDNGTVLAFGAADTLRREAIAPGTSVRLRLVNADNRLLTLALAGAPFRVAAIDGTDLVAPTDLTDARLPLAGGGRYDLTFTMPAGPVWLGPTGDREGEGGGKAGLLLSPDGTGDAPALGGGSRFDPATYGSPAATPFGAASHFDRAFTLTLDNRLGFHDGSLRYLYTINGAVFPDAPMLMVREGELVKMTFVNRSLEDHPMHLHGHQFLVLSRDGQAIGGSPWWADTLNVAPGETYEVAFRADNPGIWMDHCHNLDHAAAGMTLHLAYEGVTTPYEVGPATPNQPE